MPNGEEHIEEIEKIIKEQAEAQEETLESKKEQAELQSEQLEMQQEQTDEASKMEKFSQGVQNHQTAINAALGVSVGMLAGMVGEYNSMVNAITETADELGTVDDRVISWYDTSRMLSSEFALWGVEIADVMGLLRNITELSGGVVYNANQLREQYHDLVELQANWNLDAEILADIWQSMIIRGESFAGLYERINRVAHDTGVAVGYIARQISEAGEDAKILLTTLGSDELFRQTAAIARNGQQLSSVLESADENFSDLAQRAQDAAQFSALFAGNINLSRRQTLATAANYGKISDLNEQLIRQNMQALQQQGQAGIIAMHRFAELTGMELEEVRSTMARIRMEQKGMSKAEAEYISGLRGEVVTFEDIGNRFAKTVSVLMHPALKRTLPLMERVKELSNSISYNINRWAENNEQLAGSLGLTAGAMGIVLQGGSELARVLHHVGGAWSAFRSQIMSVVSSMNILNLTMGQVIGTMGIISAIGITILYLWEHWDTMNQALKTGLTALIPALIAVGVAINTSLGGIPLIIGAIVSGITAIIVNWNKFADAVKTWGPKILGIIVDSILGPFGILIRLLNKIPGIDIPSPGMLVEKAIAGGPGGGGAGAARRAGMSKDRARRELRVEETRQMIREERRTIERQPVIAEVKPPDIYMDGRKVGSGLTETANKVA